MYTNTDGGAECSHEKRTKELEDGKGGRYAKPLCGATVAMEAVPAAWCISGRRRRKKMEVKAV